MHPFVTQIKALTSACSSYGATAFAPRPSQLKKTCLFVAQVEALDAKGCTPLHRAAEAGEAGTASKMVLVGAALNRRDKDSFMPLHRAAFLGKKVGGWARMGGVKGLDGVKRLDGGCRGIGYF